MNLTERQMVQILSELRSLYHVTSVKAEFEAEGTRMDEAIRLKDIAMQAGLNFNLKIGGCEAVRDMFDAVTLGASRIIAPMVESPFALQKFLKAAKTHLHSRDNSIELFINIETITACQNFDQILAIAEIEELKGVVIGRVDLAGSLGIERPDIDSNQTITDLCHTIATKAKQKGLVVVVGGAISANSLPFLRSFADGAIDRYETRKVIFSCPAALNNPVDAFKKAVEFEMLWLQNKKRYYSHISLEDEARLKMIEQRLTNS